MNPSTSFATDIPRQLYLPFPYSQRIKESDKLPCDGGLLLFELSGGLFSTWSSSFGQYIQLRDHTILFKLFLTLIDRCCDIQANFVLETTVDKIDFWSVNKGELNPHNICRGFRLWIPLSVIGCNAISAVMGATYNDYKTNDEAEEEESVYGRGPKRIRTSNKTEDASHKFVCKDDLLSAIRLYFQGCIAIDNIVFDEDIEEEDMYGGDGGSKNHFLEIFSAEKYFKLETTIAKHSFQRLDDSQCFLQNYISYENVTIGSGDSAIVKRTPCFKPPQKIQDSKLIRLFTTGPGGFLKSGKDLLKYLLPTYVPPKQLIVQKLQCIASACGSAFDPYLCEDMSIEEMIDLGSSSIGGDVGKSLFKDPIFYSPVECNSMYILDRVSDYKGALDSQLREIYPICARLKCTYINRISGSKDVGENELCKTYRNITHEISTLLSTAVSGVPDIYHALLKESDGMITAMQNVDPSDKTMIMMKKMFYKLPTSSSYTKYTNFGYKMLSILVGCKTCLKLMEKQTSLFMILYSRHYAVCANKTGVSGFFIVAGKFHSVF